MKIEQFIKILKLQLFDSEYGGKLETQIETLAKVCEYPLRIVEKNNGEFTAIVDGGKLFIKLKSNDYGSEYLYHTVESVELILGENLRKIKNYELAEMLEALPFREYNDKDREIQKLLDDACAGIDNEEEMLNFIFDYIEVVDCVQMTYDKFSDKYLLTLKTPSLDDLRW